MSTKLSIRGIKGLEVTMCDVLDGLGDAASYMYYHTCSDIIEILSIEAPGRPTFKPQIIPLNSITDANYNSCIVDYLIQRELKQSS